MDLSKSDKDQGVEYTLVVKCKVCGALALGFMSYCQKCKSTGLEHIKIKRP